MRIWGTDDAGNRRGPITLSLVAQATRHFNSEDLERGNAEKGLSGGLGDGQGDWRLELESALDLKPSAYIRTPDRFLTAMHAVARRAEVGGETVHQVPIFNPGSNRKQVSWLRVANLGDTSTRVTIRGRDDAGRAAPLGEVSLTLPAHGAKRLSAGQLESSAAGSSGRLGEGKCQLSVSADGEVEVVSLLASPTGHLPNLSTTPGGAPSSTGDGNDTIAEAVDVSVGATVSGRIDSAGDVDYFRIDVSHTGTLVVWTSGEFATELELLDADGNPLAAAVRTSAVRASGVSAQATAKGDFIALNLVWKETKVQPQDRVIVKVGHKSGVGGFSLGNKHIQAGVTNVNTDNPVPRLSFSADGAGVTFDVAPHIRNPNQLELRYSASFACSVLVGISVSGSTLTVTAAQSGPAFSGPITIRVRVRDSLGLLYAELEFPFQFTREESTDDPDRLGFGCVEVQVTLNSNHAECSSILGVDGPSYRATFTNNCSEAVAVRYEWSKVSDSSTSYC